MGTSAANSPPAVSLFKAVFTVSLLTLVCVMLAGATLDGVHVYAALAPSRTPSTSLPHSQPVAPPVCRRVHLQAFVPVLNHQKNGEEATHRLISAVATVALA